MRTTYDINVISTEPLVPPRVIKDEQPQSPRANRTIIKAREVIQKVLLGRDRRLLLIVGPCSIHDEKAALDYGARLASLAESVNDRLFIVMRVYFEKPRTVLGWKGLINDPRMDDTFDIATGLRKARRIFLELADMGLPAGTEMLDPITPQYLADLVSWGAIGARTTESPTHRQMASGLSMPVGWKNATDGNVQIAIDAIKAARHPHSFLGIDLDGQTCIIHTRGNRYMHLILRGGAQGPNYHAEHIETAVDRLVEAGLEPRVMVDCSHGNSRKDPLKQERVWKDVLTQRVDGNENIIGLMLESNLFEGSQPLTLPASELKYGVSITDACIGWEKTEELIMQAYEMMAPAPVAVR